MNPNGKLLLSFVSRHVTAAWPILQVHRTYRHIEQLAREPKKAYAPGEVIPTAKDQRRARMVQNLIKTPMDPASRANDTFRDVMEVASKSSHRKLIVLEGQRLIEEAFKAGLEINYLFLQKSIKTVPPRLENYVKDQNVHVLHVSQHAMKTWSTLTTPPGIVGTFLKPRAEVIAKKAALATGIPVTIICDNIREPGNLGAILRDAAASGCKRVILSKGCVDPWDPKTLRVGCGAHFQIPILTGFSMHSILNCIGVESRGESLEEIMESNDKKNLTLSKASGESDEDVSDSCNEKKSGPSSKLSSLSSQVSPSSSFALFLADNNTETNGQKSVPVRCYTDVDYTGIENVYLVVGGETEGLSRDVLQITESLLNIPRDVMNTTVARLRIPLLREIESLNASHAFAIISFEMLRQFRLQVHPKYKKVQSEVVVVDDTEKDSVTLQMCRSMGPKDTTCWMWSSFPHTNTYRLLNAFNFDLGTS